MKYYIGVLKFRSCPHPDNNKIHIYIASAEFYYISKDDKNKRIIIAIPKATLKSIVALLKNSLMAALCFIAEQNAKSQ